MTLADQTIIWCLQKRNAFPLPAVPIAADTGNTVAFTASVSVVALLVICVVDRELDLVVVSLVEVVADLVVESLVVVLCLRDVVVTLVLEV